MRDEFYTCEVCGTGYLSASDKREHASRHTAYLRGARIASRFAAYHKKEFMALADENMVAVMIGLGEGGFPRIEKENSAPLYIYRNVFSSKERIEAMENLCAKQYAIASWEENLWLYQLTYKGFEAIAAWLQRDVVFPRNEKVKS